MKKFKFSLEKLLLYKEQQLRLEKENLGALRHEKLTLETELNIVFSDIIRRKEEYIEKSRSGMVARDAQIYQIFQEHLNAQTEKLKNRISFSQDKIEEQLEVIASMSKEIATLEKLRDKQLATHQYDLMKADEIFIEEFVNLQKFLQEA